MPSGIRIWSWAGNRARLSVVMGFSTMMVCVVLSEYRLLKAWNVKTYTPAVLKVTENGGLGGEKFAYSAEGLFLKVQLAIPQLML